MLPWALGPAPLNDSHWINLVWSDQFTMLMKQGLLWPRWLPWSHDGLGAPVFYFYGPVAFWIAGLFGMAGIGLWPSLVACAMTGLAASGAGMYAYLHGKSSRAFVATAFYMTAPYHLLDFTRRGALAEFTAMALLPLFALAMKRAVAGRPAGLALAYAALIMSHLPIALLASLFLTPMLIWAEGGLNRSGIVRAGAGLALGVGLASAYLLPALALQPYTAMDTMHGPALRPSAWGPTSLWKDLNPGLLLLGAAAVSLIVPSIILLIRARDPWAAFTLVALALALGLAAPLWRLPPLDHVQFPWRILTLAEFGVAMLIARSRIDGALLLLAMVPSLLTSILVWEPPLQGIGAHDGTRARQLATLLARHPDVIEYLPRGTNERMGIQSVKALALAARTRERHDPGGITTLRRFAFPIWQARCATGVVPTAPSREGLLQYRGQDCIVEARILPIEHVGRIVTMLTLLLTIATMLNPRRAFIRLQGQAFRLVPQRS